jgi:hypothetical protein
MTKKRPKLADFRAKYLADGTALWAARNLPACQRLAADIAAGTESFRQLDALQLLKHALGLAVSAPRPFALVYLYHDDGGDSTAATAHRAELARFAARVDTALGFRALTYQALFAAMDGAGDAAYLDYLRRRYFPGP